MTAYNARLQRRRAATIGEAVHGITHGPYLEPLAELFVAAGVGRPRLHPGWVPLAYCALARHYGSYSRLDAELVDGLWTQLTAAASAAGLEPPGRQPFQYAQHTYWRDLTVKDTDTRNELATTFTQTALADARSRGLLVPTGGGSLTHPTRQRLIYGDGTIIRPRFRHRPNPSSTNRTDPSADDHHRHDGNIYGNNFVIISARGTQRHDRVILALGRVPQPGGEAATAIELICHVHHHAGNGIQAVAYDGAFQGTHIDQIMRTTGLVVINKVHAALRNDTTVVHKRQPLGTYQHPRHRRNSEPCTHHLVAVNGRVADIALDEDGTPTITAYADRRQIKRSRRADGTYRFNLGLRLECPHATNGHWELWLSPHDNPENIRLVPPDDPDFNHLYGLRPDAESLNNTLKRTLIIDRAPSIGWERQLYDLIGFAILHNTTRN